MTLHPFIAAMLTRNVGAPGLSNGAPEDARAMVAAGRPGLGSGPGMLSVRELTVRTRAGSVPGRLLVPHNDVAGIVLYFHGGGWVVGTIDDFDTLGREIASRSGCAVLLVDYRLAPEHPFPAGLEDVEDAIRWASNEVDELVGRRVPIVVSGDSAGANLATVAARRLRHEVELALQVLVYPVTGANFDTASYRDEFDGIPLTRKDMEWFLAHYAPESEWASPDISAREATEFDGMAPVVILTADNDVLRSDGELYAAHLVSHGVDARYREFPGVVHGFLRLHNHLDVAHEAVEHAAEVIRHAVAKRV